MYLILFPKKQNIFKLFKIYFKNVMVGEGDGELQCSSRQDKIVTQTYKLTNSQKV